MSRAFKNLSKIENEDSSENVVNKVDVSQQDEIESQYYESTVMTPVSSVYTDDVVHQLLAQNQQMMKFIMNGCMTQHPQVQVQVSPSKKEIQKSAKSEELLDKYQTQIQVLEKQKLEAMAELSRIKKEQNKEKIVPKKIVPEKMVIGKSTPSEDYAADSSSYAKMTKKEPKFQDAQKFNKKDRRHYKKSLKDCKKNKDFFKKEVIRMAGEIIDDFVDEFERFPFASCNYSTLNLPAPGYDKPVVFCKDALCVNDNPKYQGRASTTYRFACKEYHPKIEDCVFIAFDVSEDEEYEIEFRFNYNEIRELNNSDGRFIFSIIAAINFAHSISRNKKKNKDIYY